MSIRIGDVGRVEWASTLGGEFSGCEWARALKGKVWNDWMG